MDDDNGNGDGYVHMETFQNYVASNDSKLDRVLLALWGEEGTKGLVKDIHELKSQSRLMQSVGSVLSGVLSAVATAIILRLIGAI